jgi:hypothetical protein
MVGNTALVFVLKSGDIGRVEDAAATQTFRGQEIMSQRF